MIITNFDNSQDPQYIWLVNNVNLAVAGSCLGKGLFFLSNPQISTFPDLVSTAADALGPFPICQPNWQGRYCAGSSASNYFKDLIRDKYYIFSRSWVQVSQTEKNNFVRNGNCKSVNPKISLSREIITYKKIAPCPPPILPSCGPGKIPQKSGTVRNLENGCIEDIYKCKTNCWALTQCCLVDFNLKCLNMGACKSPNKIVPAGIKDVDGCKIQYYKCISPGQNCPQVLPPICLDKIEYPGFPATKYCAQSNGTKQLPDGCWVPNWKCVPCPNQI